ncbi:MAG: CocE/NonD family hydrolase [Flammeovirgaceae bacterium]|nr:CocE/NonD family hydrolase [Flammeovirgaceae bacterium]
MKRIHQIASILLLFAISIQPSLSQHIQNIIREEVFIPLSDGIKLGAIVYRPAQTGKFPALVYRTPYGVDDYDSYAELPRKAAKRGYVVFLVDVRGRYRSEGNFEAYRNEKKDGYDVIEWVAQSDFCDGKVGTFGGSYPGIVQWQAMSMNPPHLVAAAPEMTPISSHHFFYYGGAFSLPWIDWFTPYILPDKRKRANDTSGSWDDEEASAEWEKSNRRQWYDYRPLNELPVFKNYAPEYFEWLKHPEQSAWWDFVDAESEFENFNAPAFLLSGWYDAAYGPEGATRAFNKMKKEAASDVARNQTRLILGPWNHTSLNTRKTKFGEIEFGEAAGFDFDFELLNWFDMQMKSETGQSKLPPVSIFVMGKNFWRSETEWPLSRTQPVSFYLDGRGKASSTPDDGKLIKTVAEKEGSDQFIFDPKNPLWDKSYEKSFPYDQREIESRQDVLVFTSAPMEQDTEVIGEIVAELFVSSTAKDTDFAITLTDVYPDGRSINLTGMDAGYLRMRYRNGFDKQELMVPGRVYPIRISQMYTANVFKSGHCIRIQVTSSKAPHYDPNPNTGNEIASEKNLIPATNIVYHSKKYPSRLILPILAPN